MDRFSTGDAASQREELREALAEQTARVQRLKGRLRAELGVDATDGARELAEEEGVDLEKVAPGNGPNGRVWKSDVEDYLASE